MKDEDIICLENALSGNEWFSVSEILVQWFFKVLVQVMIGFQVLKLLARSAQLEPAGMAGSLQQDKVTKDLIQSP